MSRCTKENLDKLFTFIGHEHNDGNERLDDLRDPILGTLLKWRVNTWFSKADDYRFTEVEYEGEEATRVEITYNWQKKTEYFVAPGAKEKADSNHTGTAEIEFVCLCAGKFFFILDETLKHHGGNGKTGRAIMATLDRANGKRL